MEHDMEAIAERLDDVSEQLADLAMAALREAMEDDAADGSRPEVEKRITRARRSVEKAAALLRGSSASTMI